MKFSSLSPYSFDVSPSCTDVPQITHDSIPIGAIPILASSTADFHESVSRTISAANAVYHGMYKKSYLTSITFDYNNDICLKIF